MRKIIIDINEGNITDIQGIPEGIVIEVRNHYITSPVYEWEDETGYTTTTYGQTSVHEALKNEINRVVENMKQYGSLFEKRLGATIEAGDVNDAITFKVNFPQIWDKYNKFY